MSSTQKTKESQDSDVVGTLMSLLVAFFVVHIVMILAAGPINELRSIITGWYRTDPPHDHPPAPATTEQGA